MRLDKELLNLNKYPLHMPGHKRNDLFDIIGSGIDITEIEGFDNLHSPNGIIKDLENEAKTIYASEHSYISVNGSTCGVLAAIHSVCKRNDTAIVARNCHMSVYNACFLLNLNVIYAEPTFDEKYGIYRYVTQKSIDDILQNNNDVSAVIITSPTYEGAVSDIKTDVPLIIDAAHGAHFGLADFLPERQYGDIVISSLHKTLPALTQTAIVNVYNKAFVDGVKQYLDIFETSSPSYVLMSSISKCFDIIKDKKLFDSLKKNLNIIYSTPLKNLSFIKCDDLTKVNISTSYCNITGIQLANKIRKYGFEVEMASLNYVIAMITIGDSYEKISEFSKVLMKIDKSLELQNKCVIKPIIPTKSCKVSEVGKTKETNFVKSYGMTAGEYIFAYPPGIPILVPGEIITEEIIKQIESMLNSDVNLKAQHNLGEHTILTKI